MILHRVAVSDIAKPLQLIVRLGLAQLNRVTHAVGARILRGVGLLDGAGLWAPSGHLVWRGIERRAASCYVQLVGRLNLPFVTAKVQIVTRRRPAKNEREN